MHKIFISYFSEIPFLIVSEKEVPYFIFNNTFKLLFFCSHFTSEKEVLHSLPWIQAAWIFFFCSTFFKRITGTSGGIALFSRCYHGNQRALLFLLKEIWMIKETKGGRAEEIFHLLQDRPWMFCTSSCTDNEDKKRVLFFWELLMQLKLAAERAQSAFKAGREGSSKSK